MFVVVLVDAHDIFNDIHSMYIEGYSKNLQIFLGGQSTLFVSDLFLNGAIASAVQLGCVLCVNPILTLSIDFTLKKKLDRKWFD